ncbi:hypothetical protein FKM82_009143 [Ascaphus truei]
MLKDFKINQENTIVSGPTVCCSCLKCSQYRCYKHAYVGFCSISYSQHTNLNLYSADVNCIMNGTLNQYCTTDDISVQVYKCAGNMKKID